MAVPGSEHIPELHIEEWGEYVYVSCSCGWQSEANVTGPLPDWWLHIEAAGTVMLTEMDIRRRLRLRWDAA